MDAAVFNLWDFNINFQFNQIMETGIFNFGDRHQSSFLFKSNSKEEASL